MQRNIQEITQKFVNRLPENVQYYRPDELRSWEFPSFLVKRIKIELKRNLEESLIVPKTDWANTQSDAVQYAWQKFVDAIEAEVRLPASYGKTVIETAVADIMEMLVQPRKNIPEVVFGQDDQLSYDMVQERVKAVVVYQHFARLIPRYMQKKELENISKSRCRDVVSTVDKKLTSRYSPLNWAQMLEPIFKLVDGEIDTNLLRLFFEDKNMPRVARKFDLINDSLTRAELIEVLSSPELLNFQGYEDDQSTLFEDQPAAKSSEQKSSDKKIKSSSGRASSQEEKEQNLSDKDTPKSESTSDVADQKDPRESTGDTENTLNSGFLGEDKPTTEVDKGDEEGSLNALFKDQDEEQEGGETATEQTELSQDDNTIADSNIQEQPEKQRSLDESEHSDTVDEAAVTESTKETALENGEEKTSEDDDEKPIWMRFMSDEEIEEYERKKKQEQQEDEIEEGFVDDPIVDLTNEDASDEEVDNLRNRLSADRENFVEEIFGGSDRAYEEAVEEIAAYNSWREASGYIEEEIFKRNLVDVYSEAAVDFTDHLQSYFMDKKSNK